MKKKMILHWGHIKIVKKEKRVKSSGKFLFGYFCVFENSNRNEDSRNTLLDKFP